MSAVWTPKYEAYREVLVVAERLTEADLAEAVEQIDAAIRTQLAEGPHPHRWTCGVCLAFGAPFYERIMAVDALDDPAAVVWIYHEVPKARMKRSDQLHFGPYANDTYTRCVATYRAAGWDGHAPEPDA